MTVEMFRAVLADAYRRFGEDQVPRLSAALSFYLMLALAPMLLLLVATLGFLMGEDTFRESFLNQVKGSMGDAQAAFLESIMATRNATGTGILASIFAFGVMLFGASGLFEQLRDSVNAIWGIKPKSCGFVAMALRKAVSVVLVIIGAIVLGGWMTLDARIHYLQQYKPIGVLANLPLWQIASAAVSILFWTAIFGAAFRYLPEKFVAWKDVTLGAFLTSTLFTLGKYVLSYYFAYSSPSAAYGSAGAIVLILLWAYYSSQIFFFGVEFCDVYAHKYGTMMEEPHDDENAVGSAGVPAETSASYLS